MLHTKTSKRTTDLTEGAVWKSLLLFFLPLLAGSLFQQLYTTMDAVVVGRFAGKEGLAAIDAVYNLLKLPVNFFVGLSTGATIIVSQYFGKKSGEELSEAVHTAVAFAFAGGLLLSILGVAFAPPLLRMLSIPDDIFNQTLLYVRVYFSGLAASVLYNIGAGILRAVGDSKTPFYYLIISSTFNMLLDLIFVGLLGYGVLGAALSTVLGQLLSAILVLRALIKTDATEGHKLHLAQIRFHPRTLKAIVSLGLPVGLQSAVYPIANMMIQTGINAMGTNSIAAWALCGKLDFLIWVAIDALGAATSTFAAQNFGAGNLERVRKGARAGLTVALGVTLLISAALFFFAEPLGKLFISATDYEVLPLTGRLMRFLAPLYFVYVFGEVLAGVMRGAGETVKPMLLTLLCTCACRVLWMLFAVPRHRTLLTIVASYPVSWLLTSAGIVILYFLFKRKKLSLR